MVCLALEACAGTQRARVESKEKDIVGRPLAVPSRPVSARDAAHTYLQARVLGVSRDGRTAIVMDPAYPGFQQQGIYHRYEIDSGLRMETVRVSALPGLPGLGLISAEERRRFTVPAGLGAELAQVGALWSGLGHTHHTRFGASAYATAFTIGDALWMSDAQGRAIAPLSSSAGYGPRFSPDGTLFAWGAYVGRTADGVGNGQANYALHLTDARTRRTARIAGADETHYELHRFNRDGTALYFTARDARTGAMCFRKSELRGGIQATAARSILCGPPEHTSVEFVLSPSSTVALVTVRHRARDSAGTIELHWLDLATDREFARVVRSGVFVLNGVMDDGLAIASVGMSTELLDPRARIVASTEDLHVGSYLFDCAWRSPRELVMMTRAGLRVVRPRDVWASASRAVF